jgi:hypothetical protein
VLSQTVVLEGESQDRFEDFLSSLTAQLKPRSEAEAGIVETMAIARWKQMRIWGVQKAGFDLEMTQLNSSCNIPATRAYMVFKKLADNSRVLDLQHRYETGYDRQFCRAYAFFLKLREKPETQLEDADFSQMSFSFATATWEPAPENIQVETKDETRAENPAPQESQEPDGVESNELEPGAKDDQQELPAENDHKPPHRLLAQIAHQPGQTTQTPRVASARPDLRNEPNFSAPLIPKQPASTPTRRPAPSRPKRQTPSSS